MENFRNEYLIAIPSYKRENLLLNTTLNLLKKYNISSSKIYIFVANKEEYIRYNNLLPNNSYHKLIIGTIGMGAIRNFIINYFSENQKILFIDDDIRNLISFKNKKESQDLLDLNSFIENAFNEISKLNIKLFGIYPTDNPYFMLKNEKTYDLCYIIGCFYGIINDKSILVSLDDKEDYERSILFYLKYNQNLRYNWIAPITRYYKQKGGMQEKRTVENVHLSAKYLADKYPNLCKLKFKKKSKYTELYFFRKSK